MRPSGVPSSGAPVEENRHDRARFAVMRDVAVARCLSSFANPLDMTSVSLLPIDSASAGMAVHRTSLSVAITGTMASNGNIHKTDMAMDESEATGYIVLPQEANAVIARANQTLAAALSPMSGVHCAPASELVWCPRWMVSLLS